MRAVEAMLDLIDTLLEFLGWQEEWRTRANPVAFWLSVVVGVALLFAALATIYALWQDTPTARALS